jgi:hypothetical protein
MSTLSQFFGSTGVPTSNNKVLDILLVGGGGGTAFVSGGGGAGRYIEVKGFIAKNGVTAPITIGVGGAKAASSPGNGSNGTATIFNYPNLDSGFFGYTAPGGGAGGRGGPPSGREGENGANGGGGGWDSTTGRLGGLAELIYPAIPSSTYGYVEYGNIGGNGASITNASGGGGGAGGAGGPGSSTFNGGLGIVNSITGSPVTYAEGGTGRWNPPVPAPDGTITPGTGNGGIGGLPLTNSTPGSPGVCVVRWPTEYPAASSVTGNDPTLPVNVTPGYYTYRWYGDGSITF